MLLNLFSSLSAQDIELLPNELSVCWYPSSGTGFRPEDITNNGYYAIPHWKEQPSVVQPNFFIFSDYSPFEEIPEKATVVFSVCTNDYDSKFHEIMKSEVEAFTKFINLELSEYEKKEIDFFKNASQNLAGARDLRKLAETEVNTDNINELTAENKLSLLLLKFNRRVWSSHEILLKSNDGFYYITKDQETLHELRIFIRSGLFKIETIQLYFEGCLKEEQFRTINDGTFGCHELTLIHYLDQYILLTWSLNEFIYTRFIEEKIQIPAMTVHRPLDSFVLSCNIDTLGVKELIGGNQYVSRLVTIEKFEKYPEFDFQPYIAPRFDSANFYSRKLIG